MRISILTFFLIFCLLNVSGQDKNDAVSEIINSITILDFTSAKQQSNNLLDHELKKAFQHLIQIRENNGQRKIKDSIVVLNIKTSTNPIVNSLHSLTKGFYHSNNSLANWKAIHYFKEVEIYAVDQNLSNLEKISICGIIELYNNQIIQKSESYIKYIQRFKKLSHSKSEKVLADLYLNDYYANSVFSPQKFYPSAKKIVAHSFDNKLNENIKSKVYYSSVIYYRSPQKKKYDSIYYYITKTLSLKNSPFLRSKKKRAYMELAALNAEKNKANEARRNIDSAKNYHNLSHLQKSIYSLNRWKAYYVHQPLKEYDSAFYYLESSMLYEAKNGVAKNQEQLAQLNIELDTAEKEKQLLEEQVKRKEEQEQKRQITIGLTATLLLGSIIAILIYRNTKRKQRIAEQDRELQIQKTETILKEKELETINAMVSGQEKERLRLASELHDNLGSTLATVRMQVENLERNLDKVDDPKALLQKTNALVNEAYTKVRSISHERNSGVLAKDGLLPAIQKLARTVSSNNNLQVDVQDFGLENRIANELEITIFRIIQELITNIIKHAQATEANISLTQHDNELNIMVEDDGKGFKVGILKEKDGMGLGSIERRVEHLEGTMEVDSAIGRGTSISIDIPL
ncbi:ATP-binding protein [uncultured Dokdonia sp.]|uniref:sensor histidine kinase n=1 Tax=uncultured Dokdonia sp. TaxID=575653 RepID=UPI0026042BF3|nr:ATP-binding protein [uncultured Dokdonia sp.]